MDGTPDARLVDEARRGNATAFAELVRRHERSMVALAYAGVRCSATASDVVQDAFIRCWKRLADLQDVSKFVPWLATTVRRLATNATRSPVRRFKLVGDEVLDGESGRAHDDPLESADVRRLVDRAIASLDETSAACVTLRYFEDLSSKEIGELLDLSPAAVDMRLSRARSALKAALERHFGDEPGRSDGDVNRSRQTKSQDGLDGSMLQARMVMNP